MDGELVVRLRGAGVIRADEEAAAIAAHVGGDATARDALVGRRAAGEPLARLIGATDFCGTAVRVDPGVYVPRWTTEAIARAASSHLPDDGLAIDLCTGCGAVAVVLQRDHPRARVLATDVDPASVACARTNGVDAHVGDLFDPLTDELRGRVDVVVAVPPFVPHDELDDLPPDVREHEAAAALDGGTGGLDVATRIADAAAEWLRHGGALVVEVGATQVDEAARRLAAAGFDRLGRVVDGDGDPCGVVGRRPDRADARRVPH